MRKTGLGIIIVMLLMIAGFIYYFEATKTLEQGDPSVRLIQTSGENLPVWATEDYRSLKDAVSAYEHAVVQEEKLDTVTHTVGRQLIMQKTNRTVYPIIMTYTALNDDESPIWKVNTYYVVQTGNKYALYLEAPHFEGPNDTSFYQDTDFGRFEYSITELGKQTINDPDIEVISESENRIIQGKYPVPEEL